MKILRNAAFAVIAAGGIASGAQALTLHPKAACSLGDVSGATACVGMVTNTGVKSSRSDTATAFNRNSFFSLSGWTQIDKLKGGASTGAKGILSAGYGSKQSGKFSFSAMAGYTYALAVKGGSGFSAYLLGTTAGSWSTVSLVTRNGKQPSLSRLSLYATKTPLTPVPVPASVLLLGSVLFGTVFVARRRAA